MNTKNEKPPCGNRTAATTEQWQKGRDYHTTERDAVQADY